MHISIITCLPKLLESPFSDSILKRAIAKELVSVDIIDLRSYSLDKHKSIDDYAFGGGAGMVMNLSTGVLPILNRDKIMMILFI
jgi:tRNA (guanine37-N1)-methyltransferase